MNKITILLVLTLFFEMHYLNVMAVKPQKQKSEEQEKKVVNKSDGTKEK